jgi:PPK2 family polyphosphate:nucleotide phosphotransferase
MQARIARLIEPLRVAPGSKLSLEKDFDPAFHDGVKKSQGAEWLSEGMELLAEYQDRLAAQDTHGVLVVLQGIDAAGKDSTIRHITSGVNAAGVHVHSFKVPSEEEVDHDFLWRYQQRLPPRGGIGIFNRSHYEEVLVVRVHPENLVREKLPAEALTDIWPRRYTEINEWERYLDEQGFKIVKLFLNLSKEEQRRRFLRRIERPEKNWKFQAADVYERTFWDDYQLAFSDMLSNTSTEWAPWYVIPADHKWFERVAAAAVIVQTLIELAPQYPLPGAEELEALETARRLLEAEGTETSPAAGATPAA